MSIYIHKKRVITQDDLQSGGTNLWRNTADFSGDKWLFNGSWKSGKAPNGNTSVMSKAWGQAYQLTHGVTAGTVYTISADVNVTENNKVVQAMTQDAAGKNLYAYFDKVQIQKYVSTGWQRLSFSFLCTKDYTQDMRFFITGNSSRYIANIKLQKGDLFTDWSPAPEDIYDELQTLKSQIGGVLSRLLTHLKDHLAIRKVVF